jgi:hypothetical protein
MGESANEQSIGSISRYSMDATSLQYRLDPNPLLSKIEMFLRGTKTVLVQDKEGNIKESQLRVGLPKANENGVQSILNWLWGIINTQVVQGNFTSDKSGYCQAYEDYLYNVRLDLGDYIMINLYDFEIEESETMGIIDFIMTVLFPYMSRLIDNKERESYAETMKNIESNTIKDNGWNFFKK